MNLFLTICLAVMTWISKAPNLLFDAVKKMFWISGWRGRSSSTRKTIYVVGKYWHSNDYCYCRGATNFLSVVLRIYTRGQPLKRLQNVSERTSRFGRKLTPECKMHSPVYSMHVQGVVSLLFELTIVATNVSHVPVKDDVDEKPV